MGVGACGRGYSLHGQEDQEEARDPSSVCFSDPQLTLEPRATNLEASCTT